MEILCFAILPSNRGTSIASRKEPVRFFQDERKGLMELGSHVSNENKYDNYITIDFDDVYHHIISKAIDQVSAERKDLKIRCERGIDLSNSGDVVIQLIKHICEADIAIIDVTGENPNVYFEYGIRQASCNKLDVLIKHKDVKLPFNIAQQRAIDYGLDVRDASIAIKKIADCINSHLNNKHTEHKDSPYNNGSFYEIIEQYSGRRLEKSLAETYVIGKREWASISVTELLSALLPAVTHFEHKNGDSTDIDINYIILNLREFMKDIGILYEKQDKSRAIEYYEKFITEERLRLRDKVYLYERLQFLYAEVGNKERSRHYRDHAKKIDELLG